MDLPPTHQSPEMRVAGHIEKRDGAWGPCPASLRRSSQGLKYIGLQTTLFIMSTVVRDHRPAFGMSQQWSYDLCYSETTRITLLKPDNVNRFEEIRSSEPII